MFLFIISAILISTHARAGQCQYAVDQMTRTLGLVGQILDYCAGQNRIRNIASTSTVVLSNCEVACRNFPEVVSICRRGNDTAQESERLYCNGCPCY